MMKAILFIIILLSTLPALAFVTEKRCGPGQDRLVQMKIPRAQARIDVLLRSVRQNLDRKDLSFNLKRKLHVAGNILHCARMRLPNLRYVCSDSDIMFAARTYPVISKNVYLADNYFTDTDRRQVATLIHEATHQCGTNDALYFEVGRPPSNYYLIGWQSIADTYSYWAEHGFCLPGQCR